MPTSRYHTSSGGHRHLYNRGVYRAGILHHNTTVSSGTNTYSGQYYSTNADGVDCRTWIEVFFRTFAIVSLHTYLHIHYIDPWYMVAHSTLGSMGEPATFEIRTFVYNTIKFTLDLSY